MRRLRESGDGLDLQPHVPASTKSLRETVGDVVHDIANRYQGGSYSDLTWDAITMLEVAQMAIDADWTSELFRTKLLAAVLCDVLRAHESGAYELRSLVWAPCNGSFSSAIIERLEMATQLAMCIMSVDSPMNGGAGLTDEIKRVLRAKPDLEANCLQHLQFATQAVGKGEGRVMGKDWRISTMKALEDKISI